MEILSIIDPGKNGITNRQMIPAVKKYLDSREYDKVKALHDQYPDVFMSSLKYIGRIRQIMIQRSIPNIFEEK